MSKVLVVDGLSYARAIMDTGLKIDPDVNNFFKRPEDFELVLFTGGEDVAPSFYGDTSPLNVCWYNSRRDERESRIFQTAVKHGIKMTGICRGIQFLNVMNGGTMMHHLEGHAGSVHAMTVANGELIYVNSLHHQMCIPGPGAVVVGWAEENLSNIYIGKNDEQVSYDGPEIEALIYPSTGCAGVQYHPEMMQPRSAGAVWYADFVNNLLHMDMDDFVDRYTKEKTYVAGNADN